MMVDAVSLSALSGAHALNKPAAASAQDNPVVNFATELAGVVRAGESAALAGVSGQMPMQDVVNQVMTAERTLNVTVAIRDKVVSAYLELSRMQI